MNFLTVLSYEEENKRPKEERIVKWSQKAHSKTSSVTP